MDMLPDYLSLPGEISRQPRPTLKTDVGRRRSYHYLEVARLCSPSVIRFVPELPGFSVQIKDDAPGFAGLKVYFLKCPQFPDRSGDAADDVLHIDLNDFCSVKRAVARN